MASPTTPTTKLEAVNLMLRKVGLLPVTTLTPSPVPDDLQHAIDALNEATRELCLEGWDWNTDHEFEIAPTASKVAVPADALRIDPTRRDVWLVERDDSGTRRMYDKDDNTFTITETFEYEVVRAFDFEEMPEAARHYAAMMGANRLVKFMMGDDATAAFNDQELGRARLLLEWADHETADHNLRNSYGMYRSFWAIELIILTR